MITATIGKVFLEAYNKKYHTNYDAKTFFVEVYHPLFFGSRKYLQWVQNSPFVQGLESASSGEFGVKEILKDENGKTKTFKNKDEINSYLKSQYANYLDEIIEIKDSNLKQVKVLLKITDRQITRMLDSFIEKINKKEIPDASIAPGFPASEEDCFATTSGQVTNMNIETTKDDIYLSWIGASLGVGVNGGYLLFSQTDILLDLFEGWGQYRKIVDGIDTLKGNQVNSWNGQWLIHRYDKRNFDPEQPMAGFPPFEKATDGMNIVTQSWTKLFIRIAQHIDKGKLIGYVYGLDPKTRLPITIGFIPINLESIRRPIDLYQKLFGMSNNEGNKAEDLWGTEYGLKESCKLGVIGVKSMQPQGLKQYMMPEKGGKVKMPKYDEKQIINFHTYQIWLLAMLNNEELWNKSIEFAQTLQTYVNNDKQNSTKKSHMVEKILASTSKKNILLALSEIASDVESFNKIEENAKIIHMMPTDNVPYYLTLIRFHYAGLSNKNNQQTLQFEFN